MKKLIITAAALMIAAAAYGQGQFLFNTRDISAGNNVTFTFNGAPATGADLFVDVLAGKDQAGLVKVGDALPLNRTGAGAGYTNPFSGIYTVPGTSGGQAVLVGYRAYQGTSYATATATSPLAVASSLTTLTEPPTPPNEVALGTVANVITTVPEPSTLALGLLGLGSLLAIRRRK